MKKLLHKTISTNLIVINIKRMWPFIKPYWGRALMGIAFAIPVGALDGAIAMFLKPFMDKVMVDKQPHFSALIPFLIVGFTIIQGILIYASSYLNTWVAQKITMSVKRRLYAKLLSLDTSYFDNNNSGTILFRYSTDADMASGGLIENAKQFISKSCSSIALVCVLLYNSWHLALMAVAVLGLIIYPMVIVRRKMKEIMTKTVTSASLLITIYNETFAGNKTIRSFTLE
ncbi:MAG: ABC transporter, partial [Elusimicrobiaceae bacterium]|nr:ABC transporter [Elusimicrobiaceae bacterium]